MVGLDVAAAAAATLSITITRNNKNSVNTQPFFTANLNSYMFRLHGLAIVRATPM